MRSRCFVLLLLLSTFCTAQTAEEILRRAEDAVKGESAHGVIKMTVVRPEFTRSLTMESWWVGNKKALIVIKAPKKEAGNKTLKIGNEMWNYLKNTQTTIKIPPSMMLQSWNGSDFTNDDLVRESNLVTDYHQKLLGEEEAGGVPCWKIELIPKENAAVVWGKLLYWVRKADDLPARVEYYDEGGRRIRYLEYDRVKNIGKRTIPTRWVMRDVSKAEEHYTAIEVLEMEYDLKIPERIFSFRELERGD